MTTCDWSVGYLAAGDACSCACNQTATCRGSKRARRVGAKANATCWSGRRAYVDIGNGSGAGGTAVDRDLAGTAADSCRSGPFVNLNRGIARAATMCRIARIAC